MDATAAVWRAGAHFKTSPSREVVLLSYTSVFLVSSPPLRTSLLYSSRPVLSSPDFSSFLTLPPLLFSLPSPLLASAFLFLSLTSPPASTFWEGGKCYNLPLQPHLTSPLIPLSPHPVIPSPPVGSLIPVL